MCAQDKSRERRPQSLLTACGYPCHIESVEDAMLTRLRGGCAEPRWDSKALRWVTVAPVPTLSECRRLFRPRHLAATRPTRRSGTKGRRSLPWGKFASSPGLRDTSPDTPVTPGTTGVAVPTPPRYAVRGTLPGSRPPGPHPARNLNSAPCYWAGSLFNCFNSNQISPPSSPGKAPSTLLFPAAEPAPAAGAVRIPLQVHKVRPP
jgi:hypothetical protein